MKLHLSSIFYVCRIDKKIKILIVSIFKRVFANETSQFLAPYEASVKPRADDSSPLEVPAESKPSIGASASHVRIVSIIAHDFYLRYVLFLTFYPKPFVIIEFKSWKL